MLSAYVPGVGKRLIAALDDDRFTFQFFVVDEPIPNAFALPGGFVYVTCGLLLWAREHCAYADESLFN